MIYRISINSSYSATLLLAACQNGLFSSSVSRKTAKRPPLTPFSSVFFTKKPAQTASSVQVFGLERPAPTTLFSVIFLYITFHISQLTSRISPARLLGRICNPATVNIRIFNPPIPSISLLSLRGSFALQMLIFGSAGLQIRRSGEAESHRFHGYHRWLRVAILAVCIVEGKFFTTTLLRLRR